jgi:hypothetical protein
MKRRRERLKAKGVTRIDEPGRHGIGWYARVVFRGKTASKYFADMSHGGTANAFKKAVAWRDAEEKRVGKPRTDRLFATGRARSPLGIPGVYESKTSYVVAWSPAPGKIRREFISWTRYGKKDALRRAIELRRRREREMYGRAVSTPKEVRRRRRR